MKPYYSREPSSSGNDSIPLRLFQGELDALIGHIPRRKLHEMPEENLLPLLSIYYKTVNTHMFDFEPLNYLRDVTASYYELINQTGPFQKMEKLCELYLGIMEKLSMGQQDLFHKEENIKNSKSANKEAQFIAVMEKYMTLHDFIVKATFSMVTYCLDLMANHKDLEKPASAYLADDLSYKLKKLRLSGYKKLDHLTTGIEPHLRNSISHRSYDFINEYTFLFKDREWAQELKIGELINLTEKLDINFNGQATALTLFAFDNQPSINKYLTDNPKEITQRTLLEQLHRDLKNLGFISDDIDIKADSIICRIKKVSGFDGPSEIFGNLGKGLMMHGARPALELDKQVSFFIGMVVQQGLSQKTLDVIVLNFDNKECRRYKANLPGLLRVMLDQEPQENGPQYLDLILTMPDCE